MAGEVYVQQAAYGDRAAIDAAVETLFASLPAAERLGAASRVLVKPNLLSKHKPETAVATHPDVVRAVVLACQRRGASDITIADSPGGPYTPKVMQGVYAVCGMQAVAGETGAKLYTACESGEQKAAGLPHGIVRQFTLIRPVLGADFIINVPKMKTHVMAYMSGAVKNLFGCVPGLQKAEFHMRFPERQHFGQMLVDVCEAVGADLHIVDGVLALEGDGPAGGTPREVGILLGGENPYHLDLALCHLMGLDAMHAPMLAAAAKNGLCEEALAEALFIGDDAAKQPIAGYQPPRSYEGRTNFISHVPKFLQPLAEPLTRLVAPKPKIRSAKCIGCGKCAEICPQQVIDIGHGKAHIHYKNCIRCFCCHEMCPVKAIDVSRSALLTKY